MTLDPGPASTNKTGSNKIASLMKYGSELENEVPAKVYLTNFEMNPGL